MKKKCFIAIFLFLVLYSVLTVPWIFWPFENSFLALTMFALYLLLAIGLACDTTEVILAFCWRSHTVPRRDGNAPREKVATVMTICNDASHRCLIALRALADAGYVVYLLDDSETPAQIPKKLIGSIKVVRRPTRRGWKAGNLNYWLKEHGNEYEYVLILDSDSLISVNAVDGLLLTAEHPTNANVAIFQAKTHSHFLHSSLFSRILATGARPRMRIIERVHAPLNLMLSFGHNLLLRLESLHAIGGFDETLSCEDTTLSLNLAATGWRVELVDVWSYDTDPPSPTAYVRRTIRWARQTVEIFHRPWYEVPLRLKLLLCRHLLAYLLPFVGTALLALSLWNGPASTAETLRFLSRSLAVRKGYSVYATALWPAIAVFFLFILLRISLALREGVSLRRLFLSVFWGSTPYFILIGPLAVGMFISAIGYRVQFTPTNSRRGTESDKKIKIKIFQTCSAGMLLGFLIFSVLRRPGSLLVGFNILWIIYFVASPVNLLLMSMMNRKISISEPER